MVRDIHSQDGSRPPQKSLPYSTPSAASGNSSSMLSASSSNNHSLFSFGRSNGSSGNSSITKANGSTRVGDGDIDMDNNDLAEHTTSFDFLPSVSFDDLQSSLESASTEFKLSQFPSPSGQGNILPPPSNNASRLVQQASIASFSSATSNVSNISKISGASSSAATVSVASASAASVSRSGLLPSSSAPSITPTSRVSKSGSILRRPSISTRQNSVVSSTSAASEAPSTSIAVSAAARQRRQSHYPPVSNSSIAKPPRKSVGPGLFDPEYNSSVSRSSSSRRRPSLTSNPDRRTGSARSSIDGGSRLSDSSSQTGSRASKTRSFQYSSNKGSTTVAAQGPKGPRGSSGAASNATVTNGVNGHSHANGADNTSTGTPSGKSGAGQPSSAKRMSVAPGVLNASHATGLGARTVSPTDARRMKRMSIMPPSAGGSGGNGSGTGNGASGNRDIPQTSNVPLPTPADPRASSRSPSVLPRKSATPSSSRTTPDPNRKSYSSGLSVGSSMSFSTVRTSTGSGQPRNLQGSGATAAAASTNSAAAGSRLPAPKTLGLHNTSSNGEDDEDVPPVPAIPKAYESPKDSPAELSFFEKRRSNLAFDASSIHSTSTTSLSGGGQLSASLDPPAKIQRKASTRNTRERGVDKANHTINVTASGKKSLQPLRLPPINLMPLSTPTANKIAALHEQAAHSADRNLSPPPSRIIAKTPTTPMTAHKASFFSRHRNEDRADLPSTIRSSSSVHFTRNESPVADDSASSSDSMTADSSVKMPSFSQPSVSPFLSSSVPKSVAMDPSFLKRPRTGDGSFPPNFTTPALPPIPVSATAQSRPSGPRAPAPTPSRAFAAIDTGAILALASETPSKKSLTSSASASTVTAVTSAGAPGSNPSDRTSPEPLASPDEPPTPSSIGSSLRRKLSLSWKRNNNSKTSISLQQAQGSQAPHVDKSASEPPQSASEQQRQERQDRQDHQHHHHLFLHHHQRQSSSGVKQQYDGMPPPRIPTLAQLPSAKSSSPSAALAAAAASGAPSLSTRPSDSHLESRRRKTSASSLSAILAQEKPRTASSDVGVATAARGHGHGNTSGHPHVLTHAHAFPSTHSQKVLRPKASTSSMRHQDGWTADLDRDDLVAEEEMRKLGSRRKETELAARTLDALRKRATPKERVGSQEAIRIAMLNIYERGEIMDYKDVYFCGTQNAAKVVGDINTDTPNFGYDDERGDYSIVPGDHLAYRYEIIDTLGKGSFGQVVRCIDHKTGVLVAVKIIRNKKRFHQQALVEVNILQKLREWVQDPHNKHSMVNFTHSFYFRSHLCISTELLDMNLYEFIKANSFRGFSLKLIRRFTKQMLSSLNLLKQHKVIHCDLKPENILLRHPLHSEIKVIDFGSSCFENEKVYTYIQSRFYRSPEVILGMTYGMPIDMWSLGCILAELYTGVPIFPGENEQEQLACIMEVFGPPEKHLIEKSTRKKLFFDSMGKPRLTVSSKGRRRRPSSKTLQQVIKCDDEAFLDFLARCLRWDPDRRLKPEEAIRHEYITGIKAPLPVPRGISSNARDGSPIRRHNTISSTGPRPLPDPPGTFKLGVPPTMRGPRESLGASPHKSTIGGPARRASTVTSTMAGGGSGSSAVGAGKRTSGGTGHHVSTGSGSGSTVGIGVGSSNLPRASGRVVSGTSQAASSSKSDLASAGATAAMTRRA